jgi:hypothetical protein
MTAREEKALLGPNSGLSRGSHGNRWAWLFVVAVAFLIFELTANAALSVLVGCLKFGWDELRLARWVKRHHPDRIRGKVLARWLTAFGLWKTSVVAFVLMMVVPLADVTIRAGPGRAPSVEFFTALYTMLFGFLASGFYSIVATLSALRRRVRIWIGHRCNLAVIVLWTSGFFMVFFAWCVVTMTIAIGLAQIAPLVGVFAPIVGLLIGPATSFLLLKDRLEKRVLAPSPDECWDVAWVERSLPRASVPLDPHLATIDEFGLEA